MLGRSLTLDAARVTEIAAIAATKLVGLGDEKAADQAAVDAMRTGLNELDIDGRIVIGEGERDEAPMLYIGEKVGTGKGPGVDIALDPLEGTTLTAKAMANHAYVDGHVVAKRVTLVAARVKHRVEHTRRLVEELKPQGKEAVTTLQVRGKDMVETAQTLGDLSRRMARIKSAADAAARAGRSA